MREHADSVECWCEPSVEAQPNGAMLVSHQREDPALTEAFERVIAEAVAAEGPDIER